MNNWKCQPADERLTKYIHAYWYLEKTPKDTSLRFPRLIPNPLAHLIIAPPEQSHSYQSGQSLQVVEKSHLIMPSSRFIEMDHRQSFIILGVTFQPGIAYSGFGLSQEQMSNQIFSEPQQFLTTIELDQLEAVLHKAAGDSGRITSALDQIFLPLLDVVREDSHTNLVGRALKYFQRHSIARIEKELNCSRRTLERSFLRVTGFTLKQYHSMARLNNLIEYLYKHRDQSQNWADVALMFGFSDQPHLIRELKKSIGITPGHYAQAGNLTIDAYGDFE